MKKCVNVTQQIFEFWRLMCKVHVCIAFGKHEPLKTIAIQIPALHCSTVLLTFDTTSPLKLH